MDPLSHVMEVALGTPSVSSVVLSTRSARAGAGAPKTVRVRSARGVVPLAKTTFFRASAETVAGAFDQFLKEHDMNPRIAHPIARFTQRAPIDITDTVPKDPEALFPEDRAFWRRTATTKDKKIMKQIPLDWEDSSRMDINKTLLIACRNGNLEAVKSAIRLGANVNFREGAPLIKACRGGFVEIVRELVNAGANINAGEGAPLLEAVKSACKVPQNLIDGTLHIGEPDLRIINMLIEASVNKSLDIDAQNAQRILFVNSGNGAPLIEACGCEYGESIVHRLVEAGANVNIRNGAPLIVALEKTNDSILANFLISKGANAGNGKALVLAIKFNYYDIVHQLIRLGADVNVYHGAPLKEAIASGNPDIVKMLIRAGANVNVDDIDYGPPIIDAIYTGQPEIVKMIIDAGANVNIGYYGEVLKLARKEGNPKIIKLLVNAGAE